MEMEYQAHLYSKAYAATADTHPYSIQVDQRLWEEIMRNNTNRRIFLSIQQVGDTRPAWIAPLGSPVQDEEINGHRVYMPLWMIDSGHFYGLGEPVEVRILNEECFPAASRIILRVIDSAFYNTDVKAELESALSSMGVIRTHTTLQIPLESMGQYSVDVFVAATEPADVVFCEGDEVAVEFEEPVDQIAAPPPPPRPPTPIPEQLSFLSTDGLPPPPSFRAAGDFVPFGGEGMRLGSSNDVSTRPPWHDAVLQRRRVRP
jgi:hypothetical protein